MTLRSHSASVLTRLVRGALAVAALTLLLGSAGCASPAEPKSFELDYATGSIPPPSNYRYTVRGSVIGDRIEVRYELAYLYREGMTAEELEQLGYSTGDDIVWTGTLTGEQARAWLDVIRATTFRDPPQEAAPGADNLEVTVDGRTGEPVNRDDWERVAGELDAYARREIGHSRPTR